MPLDKNGRELQVGDKVVIHATVRSIAPGLDRYNIGVDTDEFLFPETIKVGFHLNSKQVEKFEAPAVQASPAVEAKPPEAA